MGRETSAEFKKAFEDVKNLAAEPTQNEKLDVSLSSLTTPTKGASSPNIIWSLSAAISHCAPARPPILHSSHVFRTSADR